MGFNKNDDSHLVYKATGFPINACLFWSIVAFCVGVVTLVLIATSIVIVDANEINVVVRDVPNTVDAPRTSGTYFVSPDSVSHRFPLNFVPFSYHFTCLSRDGVPVSLRTSFATVIIADGLADMFIEIGEQDAILSYVKDMAKTSVWVACSNFIADDFYLRREVIQRNITNEFHDRVLDSQLVQMDVGETQLQNYDLPQVMIDLINDEQRAIEAQQVALQERSQRLTVANTELVKANQTAETLIANAKINAQAIISEGQTTRASTLTEWSERAETMRVNMISLNQTSDEYLATLRTRAVAGTLSYRTRLCLDACTSGPCVHCWYLNATSPNFLLNV